ncbi:ribbon-helix-helix protein, CopG family, partial [Microcoleus sp. herbarium12]|uniref:ribbon-helix-helix protein, CopG family n=1 Tax=Microcoleus sp. herbarium12 TaxID=3055437 RepID=UPI002FCEFE4E
MVKKNRNVVSSNPDSKVKVGLSLTPSSADRLNAIARKLGISRSELLERLAQGALDISKDKAQVTVTWKKGEEATAEIADLPGETAEKSEIEDAITAETLLGSVTVQSNPLQPSYETLQQQLSERESSIAQLQQQLADKQNLESQLPETVSKSSYETLQQQFAEKEHREQELQQQLTSKSSDLESLQHQFAEKESSANELQQQLASKSSDLESLQHQFAEKESSANELQQQLTS